jgi:magnesium chelatase family protein
VGGPLLDRIDLHIEVQSVAYKEMRGRNDGPSSADMRARVFDARTVPRRRGFDNAHIPSRQLRSIVRWTKPASERSSWRSAGWVSALARMTASLKWRAPSHLAEAVQYRSLDRYWS